MREPAVMRRFGLLFVLIAAAWMSGDHPLSAQQNAADACPLRYRRDTAEADRVREAKKAELRARGMPERFLHLLDNARCVACIETASDSFHIQVEYNDDENAPRSRSGGRISSHGFRWDPHSERQVRELLAAGKIRKFYIYNTARRCHCCPEVGMDTFTAESYADWDPDDEVNKDQTIEFDDPSDLGPLPEDLTNPPPDWINDVPNIQQFTKPPRRVLQATCKACEGLAAQWNQLESNRNFLWDQKLAQQERISIIENAVGQRQNEIARLEYQQLFASTASAAGRRQIEELQQINADQLADRDRAERELARLDGEIAGIEAQMAAVMKKFLECEEACRKTLTNTAAAPNTPSATLDEKTIARNRPNTIADSQTSSNLATLTDKPAGTPAAGDVTTNSQDGLRVPRDGQLLQMSEVFSTSNDRDGVFVGGSKPTGDVNMVPDPPSLLSPMGPSLNLTTDETKPLTPDTGKPPIAVNDRRGILIEDSVLSSRPPSGDGWRACSETNTCPSVDEDCGIPGTCPAAPANSLFDYNLTDPSGWSTSSNADVESRIQIKFGDIVVEVVVQPAPQPRIGQWFNPLGLLARRLTHHLDRWRGSAGPRPLITPRDVALVEKYTGGQNAGLPKGLHVLLTDRGGSTGKTLAVQVLNLTGQPVRLSSLPFVIEPIRQQAQARVQQAFNRLANAAPVKFDLAGYCVEFLKPPPAANQIFRLAPASLQKKYEAMSKVLRSAYRVQHAGVLRPDSNPAAYVDSIKQWALWAVEQKFNERSFTEAFLGHTRKNLEAAGQQWSKPAEDMVRKVSPNRWRDIVKVLHGAGVPVPQ